MRPATGFEQAAVVCRRTPILAIQTAGAGDDVIHVERRPSQAIFGGKLVPRLQFRRGKQPAFCGAVPGGHMSVEQKLVIGRRLVQVKASLPHGHFGPWLDRQQGLARSMAQQCMSLARTRQGDC